VKDSIRRPGTGAKTSRSETVSVRLEPKTAYLAELAARYQQRTLSSFIEWCVRQTLKGSNMSDEPSYNHDLPLEQPLWCEGLWDVDEADRFFLLASAHPDWLTNDEQCLWKLISETAFLWSKDRKISRKILREHWDKLRTESTKGGWATQESCAKRQIPSRPRN
jgi:hypothetical protein